MFTDPFGASVPPVSVISLVVVDALQPLTVAPLRSKWAEGLEIFIHVAFDEDALCTVK
jgi:hypothetical protein